MNVLEQISIVSEDLAKHAAVFEAICGRPFETGGINRRRQCLVGHALIELEAAADRQSPGLSYLRLGVADLAVSRRNLADLGIEQLTSSELELAPANANGIKVRVGAQRALASGEPGPARFDHVAICVADLEDAARRWAAITDTAPSHVGEHPLGQFDTARFLLGTHMIELVSPKAGVDSAVAKRLEGRGEGVMAIAVVATDLDATRDQLKRIGARLVEDPPHTFVHPRDAAGLLVQLTPRVDH